MKATIQSKAGLKTLNLNRRKAIRERCLNCSAWSTKEVSECKFTECPLYPFREGRGRQNPEERAKAIRSYCFWCQAGQRREIARCLSKYCALFRFRKTTKERAKKPQALPEMAHIDPRIEANPIG